MLAMAFPIFPPEASRYAQQVDGLFSYLMAVCGLVLTAIVVVMTYFLIKYRRGTPVYRRQRVISSTPFELTWTVIPLIFFLTFFVWGANLYYQEEIVPEDGLEIHVIGRQWMWKIQHAEGQREINELHVPLGRTIKLEMATQDVIHDFSLPAFRIKQDVVPGRYTTLWFNSNRIGNYPIYCSQYCGADHSFMVGRLIVMTPEDYQAWLERGKPQEPLVASGARLFRELGCSGCHVGSRVVRAPPLEGLYGKPVPLQSGDFATADDNYIHDKILYPKQNVPAGYAPVMPSYRGQVNEEQIFELVAYIKSLATASPVLAAPSKPRETP